MKTQTRLTDSLKRYSASPTYQAAGAWLARLLSPPTPQEDERRRAHLFALLVVAVVATGKDVSGLTGGSATYTVYLLAVAISALGGLAPACVALLASVLLLGAYGHPAVSLGGRLAFALEGLGVAAIVVAVGRRVRTANQEIETLHTVNADLREQARRGDITRHALQHFEDIASDAAVFLVSAQGLIVEWSKSAERMYGWPAESIVGSSLATILSDAGAATDVQGLLTTRPAAETARQAGVHRRADGTRVHVEFEVRQCGPRFSALFTVAVQDVSRRRESEAFREAALRAQTALQTAADEANGQLAVLESLTDPSVNPVGGPAAVDELLGRLRSSIGADGVALAQFGVTRSRFLAGAGLRPVRGGSPGAAVSSGATDNRVTLVHNDSARVAQVSVLTWAPTVLSIMVVPVCQIGQSGFRLEVVNEQRWPATEFDLALSRIVADRLAQAIALQMPADSSNAVA